MFHLSLHKAGKIITSKVQYLRHIDFRIGNNIIAKLFFS